MRILDRGLAAGAAVLAGLVLTLTGAAPAQAAPYDGANPNGHACNNSSTYTARTANVTIRSGSHAGAVLGRVELRYSPTCRTVWGRLINYMNWVPGDTHEGAVWVHRNSDGREYGRVQCDRYSGTYTSCWTRMVNDANVTSFAYAEIDGYDTYGYTTATGRTSSY